MPREFGLNGGTSHVECTNPQKILTLTQYHREMDFRGGNLMRVVCHLLSVVDGSGGDNLRHVQGHV